MVVSGEIPACVEARQACQRFLDDLEKSKAPDYSWRFDLEVAGRACAWIELLPNIDEVGWPNLKLELAQKFWLGNIFGWVRKTGGIRRFTRVYISIPRKNAKTTLMAGVGLYMLALDGEQSAQVYNGANKLEQAMLLFQVARAMVEARPELFARLGIEKRGERCLYCPRTNGRWRPISKRPGDGGGASCFIQDEYHEAKNDDLSEAMVPGQIARKQPLDLKITTAGTTIGGPCDRYEQQMRKVLEGTIQRERTFTIIYTVDLKPYVDPFGVQREPDDWTSMEAGQKANPLWGVSIDPEKYAVSLEEAKQDPHKAVLHKTKHLNIWCNAADGFYDIERWKALADPDLKLERFTGAECLIGLDLASKYDLCSIALLFREMRPTLAPQTGEETLEEHWYVFCQSYLPGSVGNKPENTDYRIWRDAGFLTITPGNITDYGFILRDLLEATQAHDVREVPFDQRESGFLLQEFEKVQGSVPTFEVPQTTQWLSEPMKWLKSLVIDGRIHHNGDPVLQWAMSNVAAKYDPNENVFPRHAGDNQDLKIDPHSALLNAAVRARIVLSQPASDEDTEVEVW